MFHFVRRFFFVFLTPDAVEALAQALEASEATASLEVVLSSVFFRLFAVTSEELQDSLRFL
jgi:predicted dinucleotide-binding enzyme